MVLLAVSCDWGWERPQVGSSDARRERIQGVSYRAGILQLGGLGQPSLRDSIAACCAPRTSSWAKFFGVPSGTKEETRCLLEDFFGYGDGVDCVGPAGVEG